MIIEMAKGIGAFVVIMILAIVNFTVAWRLGATVTTLGWVSLVPAVPVFFSVMFTTKSLTGIPVF